MNSLRRNSWPCLSTET